MASLVAAMAWFLVGVEAASHVPNAPWDHDLYAYFYPTILAAVRAVRGGGRGLLWNPFQNCGQPFLGEGATGLLYPPDLLFFVLSPDRALYGLLFVNMAVGTVSAYLLCRELDLGVIASWCGGLAFGLSNASSNLATGAPLIGGSYPWLPAGMLFCERILRTPTLGAALGLGVTAGIALTPGHPQLVFYLYELIALRLVWELATRRAALTLRTLGMLGLGLALPPLLAAVQLIPNLEMVSLGTRGASRTFTDMSPGGFFTWTAMRRQIAWHIDVNNPFQLAPFVAAAAAIAHPRRRSVAAFWILVVGLTLVLALGPNGFLFPLYARLPFGMLFSDPSRFLWITSFAVAVLAGIGVDAAVRASAGATPYRRRLAVVATLAAGIAGGWAIVPYGFLPTDRWTVGCVVVAGLAVVVPRRMRPVTGAALAAALIVDLIVFRAMPFRHLLPDGSELFARAPLFARLRTRLTEQDRVYLARRPLDFSLQERTGTLLRVPILYDYLPQPTRRWAAYFVKMRTGGNMRGIYDWEFLFGGWFPPTFQRRLLDLAAGRYLVVADSEDQTGVVAGTPFRMIGQGSDVRIYENPTALARARFVPQVEVVPDAEALLQRLATGEDDLRRVALVEKAPAGAPGDPDADPGAGTVELVEDEPEHVVADVHAPAAGFLFLADADYPGWRARVDGVAVPITRANYVFRLVPVPAGHSVVDFRYRPVSVVIGAAVTGATLVVLVALVVVARRRPWVGGSRDADAPVDARRTAGDAARAS